MAAQASPSDYDSQIAVLLRDTDPSASSAAPANTPPAKPGKRPTLTLTKRPQSSYEKDVSDLLSSTDPVKDKKHQARVAKAQEDVEAKTSDKGMFSDAVSRVLGAVEGMGDVLESGALSIPAGIAGFLAPDSASGADNIQEVMDYWKTPKSVLTPEEADTRARVSGGAVTAIQAAGKGLVGARRILRDSAIPAQMRGSVGDQAREAAGPETALQFAGDAASALLLGGGKGEVEVPRGASGEPPPGAPPGAPKPTLALPAPKPSGEVSVSPSGEARILSQAEQEAAQRHRDNLRDMGVGPTRVPSPKAEEPTATAAKPGDKPATAKGKKVKGPPLVGEEIEGKKPESSPAPTTDLGQRFRGIPGVEHTPLPPGDLATGYVPNKIRLQTGDEEGVGDTIIPVETRFPDFEHEAAYKLGEEVRKAFGWDKVPFMDTLNKGQKKLLEDARDFLLQYHPAWELGTRGDMRAVMMHLRDYAREIRDQRQRGYQPIREHAENVAPDNPQGWVRAHRREVAFRVDAEKYTPKTVEHCF